MDTVILLRFSLHFVVGYPFIVLVSNFIKFFFVGRLLERPGRGAAAFQAAATGSNST